MADIGSYVAHTVGGERERFQGTAIALAYMEGHKVVCVAGQQFYYLPAHDAHIGSVLHLADYGENVLVITRSSDKKVYTLKKLSKDNI